MLKQLFICSLLHIVFRSSIFKLIEEYVLCYFIYPLDFFHNLIFYWYFSYNNMLIDFNLKIFCLKKWVE